MRKLLLLFCTLFFSTLVSAQIYDFGEEFNNSKGRRETGDTLDKAVWLDILYEHTDVDTLLHETLTVPMMLQVGKTHTRYIDYVSVKIDSFRVARNFDYTMGDYFRIVGQAPGHVYYWIRALGTNTFTESHSTHSLHIRTQDSTAVMDWQLHDDTMRICGYLCHKATAKFRGRTWTTWWTAEIPTDAGPWKLQGLPGLILRAEDSLGMHLMEAKRVNKPISSFIAIVNEGFRTRPRDIYVKRLRAHADNFYKQNTMATFTHRDPSLETKRGFLSEYEDAP